MAILKFHGTGISALAAAVPSGVINNYAYTDHFSQEDVREVVDKVGIHERRFAPEGMCASDLCFAAAEEILTSGDVNREEIDALLFVSQTPDYRMPATSALLQQRLGLSMDTITYDINQGCAGFIFGLSMGYSLLQQGGIRKVLLLDGETRSRVYSPKDRKTAFIFGDAGAAALLERQGGSGDGFFSLNTDGSRAELIMIKGGGYRNPSSPETLKEKKVDEYGNIRSDEQGYMNGPDVFNFLIREVPKDIKRILQHAGMNMDEFDHYVFHQANSYMNSYLLKKLKLDPERVPMSIQKYGNTSSVSIPLTMVHGLGPGSLNGKDILLSGFGVGLSWATALLHVAECRILPVVEL